MGCIQVFHMYRGEYIYMYRGEYINIISIDITIRIKQYIINVALTQHIKKENDLLMSVQGTLKKQIFNL